MGINLDREQRAGTLIYHAVHCIQGRGPVAPHLGISLGPVAVR